MTAGIARRQRHRPVDFLRALQLDQRELAVFDGRSAGVEIEDPFGIDQVAVILHQPRGAGNIGILFARRERQDDVANRLVTGTHQRQHAGHERGGRTLVVDRAAAVDPAVLFGGSKGLERPIAAQRVDHVEVGEKKDRFRRTGAANPHDEVLVLRLRPDQLDIARAGTPAF